MLCSWESVLRALSRSAGNAAFRAYAPQSALDHLFAAQELLNTIQTNDRNAEIMLGEANVLKAQGDVLYFLKQTNEALEKYEAALGLFRAVGARLDEANVLQAQGDSILKDGEEEPGMILLENARQLYKQVGATAGQANINIILARHCARKGMWTEAVLHMQLVVDFCRKIGLAQADGFQSEIDQWKINL